jgi:putative Ca2+/H+ antiporter (TMEM165/GDT1 family)
VTGVSVSFAEAVLLAFWAVLVAELVGDRSMYALASLSLRFRWAVVFASFTIANASKMAVAVLLAHVITRFQSHWTYLVSAVAFFISAILIWVDESHETGHAGEKHATRSKTAFVCCCSFFLTEWGDPGQIAAAALVLRFHLTLATWLGATLALMLKGAFAIIVGLQIRDRLPVRTLRILSSVSCCVLGVLAAAQSVVAQV